MHRAGGAQYPPLRAGEPAIAREPFPLPHGPEWDASLAEASQWFESVDYGREEIIPAFEQVARECIADGAEVICTACGLFSCLSLADWHTVSGTAVPVLEAMAVGIKAAEMARELKRTLGISTSKHLAHRPLLSPPNAGRIGGAVLSG